MGMCQSFYSFICFEGMGGPVTLVELNKQHCSSTSTRCFGSTISYHKKLTCNRSTREDEAFFFFFLHFNAKYGTVSVFFTLCCFTKKVVNSHWSNEAINIIAVLPPTCIVRNPMAVTHWAHKLKIGLFFAVNMKYKTLC